MDINIRSDKQLKFVKIVYSVYIATVLIYALVIYWVVPTQIGTPLISLDNSTITIIEVIFGIISIWIFIYVIIIHEYLFRRLVRKHINPARLVVKFIIRCAMFESVAIYGLIIGIIGAKWPISLSFLMVSAIALVLSFPTRARWERLTEKQQGI